MIWSKKMHFTRHILPLGFVFKDFSSQAKRPWKCQILVGSLFLLLGSLFLLLWLTFPPPLAHFPSSFGSNYLLTTQQLAVYTYQCKEEEKWAWAGGKVSLKRRKSEPTKTPLGCLLAYGEELLAAMSSSRCAVVTQFVFPSVHLSLFLCFRVLGVLSSPKEFQ